MKSTGAFNLAGGDPKQLLANELKLRFFEIGVRISSDAQPFIDFMASMYPRFRVADDPPATPVILDFHLYTRPDNPWGKPVFVSVGEVWPLERGVEPFGYVYDAILGAILAQVRGYLLIHAGVVARGGKAILIAGDSGHGKTTLVLGLIQRGWKFLSDELAPIARRDRRVAPFPRSLRLRPGTLELAGLPPAPPDAPVWFGKYLLDIDQIASGSLGAPSEIGAVIILKTPGDGENEATPAEGKELAVFVNRMDEGLLAAVEKIEGVSHAWQTVELGYPVIRLRAARRMAVLAKVEAICRERGILVIDVSKRRLAQPSFAGPASLTRLSKSQAAMELVRQFQPAHKSALLSTEYNGDATRLFLEIIDALDQADCYQLTPGRLEEMVDLIDHLHSSGGIVP